MSKVLELKKTRRELVAKLAPIAEKESLTADEERTYGEMKSQAEGLAKQIERIEFVESERAVLDRLDPVPSKPRPEGDQPRKVRGKIENPGFECLGEVVYCARFQPGDSRLRALQEMGVGESGGFAIPDEFNPTLREVGTQEAIVRPRATVVPAGASPDADLVLPALNQSSAANMYGGVEVSWIGEGGDKPETGAKIKECRWSPKEVAAHIVVTDKLLRNWSSASALLDRLLRNAILAAEDTAFLKAAGGDSRPMGVLAAPCLKKVNRAGANAVGEAVWVVNPRVIPKLRKMKDEGNHLIWQEDARSGAPATLLGRPVLKNYRSPALGTLGDVLLANFAYYVIKDGVGLTVAASEHVLFKQNKTVVKAFKAVDGAPWLDGPIAQEDAQTYSPFVALDVP